MQKRLNKIEQDLRDATAEHRGDLEVTRAELHVQIVEQAAAAVDRGRRYRRWGTILVAIGAIIGMLGNLA
jgi:hypothetical protein